MQKNTSGQYVAFQAISSTTGGDVTSGSATVYITIDGGSQSVSTNSAVHEGNGCWSLALTQGETNGDHIVYTFVLSGAISQSVNVYPKVAAGDATATNQTSISNAIAALNNFDPSSDAVATVTTVGSVTNAVTTDAASRTASQADVSALATAASISALNDFDPSTDTVANVTTTASVTNAVTTDAASRTASQANISGLSTFDPSTDTVANVTTVGSVTNAVETDTASRNASKADVSALATSAEISALNDFDPATQTVTTDAASRTASQANISSLATAASISALNDLSQADVRTAVGLASANLDTQLGDIPTVSEFNARTLIAAAYFDPSSDTVANVTTVGSVTNGVTASTVTDKTGYSISGTKTTLDALNDIASTDIVSSGAITTLNGAVANVDLVDVTTTNTDMVSVAGLSTFDPSTDTVANVTSVATCTTNTDMRGTDNSLLAASAPSNWSTLIVGTGADAGKVTTSNPASGSGSNHTAQDVANLILVTPANKLATDSSGDVAANNMRGTDGANTIAPDNTSIAAILVDTGTTIPNSISALNDFDPALDTVANVTTVGSVTNAVTTDTASRDASKADVSGLSTFNASTDTVTTDAASRTASQADVSSLATQASVNTVDTVVDAIKVKTDQLTFTVANQVDSNALTGGGGDDAATIYAHFTSGSNEDAFKADVSGLSTFNAATDTVANVTTVGSVTNPVATDTASRTASQADVSALATSASIAALNDFNPATDTVANVTTVGSVTSDVTTDAASRTASQADISTLATAASIAALNDLSSTDVENAVWDSSYASHVTAGTFGKLMDQLRKANQAIDGEVSGTPTASAFDSNLTGYTTGAFDSELLLFVSGPLLGESRPVLSYNATNGRFTFEEPFTAAPSASDEFVILPQHIHAISEIQNNLATSAEITALNDLSAADVNAQVLDVLTVDTFAEPSSVPAATSSLVDKLSWVYTLNRNKLTQTSTTLTVRDDVDGTNIATSNVSDDGTTFTRGEYT